MGSLTTRDARIIYGLVPGHRKRHPADADEARAISLMAQNANQATPHGCAVFFPDGEAQASAISYYVSPGSPIIKGKKDSNKFIAFIHENMDDNHHVPWFDLTGREHFEWYEAWEAHGRTHLREEVYTRGLRGTNLTRVTTEVQLRQPC